MKRIVILSFAILFCVFQANAQTEPNERKNLSANDSTTINPANIASPSFNTENLKLDLQESNKEFDLMKDGAASSSPNLSPDTYQNLDSSFRLWQGGHLVFNGGTSYMPGLMDFNTGSLNLYQDFGKLHLQLSGTANNYWLPMQRYFNSQYGLGGAIGYDISDAVSLHAYVQYYNNNPIVGAAFSPYMNTSAYGGYADIRFSEHFGSNVGVRRYINPMSGRWTSEPIVTPYYKVNGKKFEFPIGDLLKTLIWGDIDNPMRFKPKPLPPPQYRKR